MEWNGKKRKEKKWRKKLKKKQMQKYTQFEIELTDNLPATLHPLSQFMQTDNSIHSIQLFENVCVAKCFQKQNNSNHICHSHHSIQQKSRSDLFFESRNFFFSFFSKFIPFFLRACVRKLNHIILHLVYVRKVKEKLFICGKPSNQFTMLQFGASKSIVRSNIIVSVCESWKIDPQTNNWRWNETRIN